MKIRKILLPTDGSAFSERAMRYAIFLACCLSASLTGLHVIQIRAPKDLSPENVDKQTIQRAHLCLKRVEEEAEGEVLEVDTKTLFARSISNAILEELEKGGYDLVVMGSHGITGFKKFVLGSVSEAVVHRAKTSVLIIR